MYIIFNWKVLLILFVCAAADRTLLFCFVINSLSLICDLWSKGGGRQ